VIKGLTDASLAEVKVSSRISRRNYGTVYRTLFIPGQHIDEDKIWDPMVKNYKASNQIEWHLRRGDDIWDHEPVVVGRHRNVSSSDVGPSGSYYWKESIYACDLTSPPTRKTSETEKLGDIRAEVNIRHLSEKVNVDNKPYRSLKFKIEMNVCGSGLEFAIMFDGKRIAQKNIDIDFEPPAAPPITTTNASSQIPNPSSTSSLASLSSPSPSMIAPPRGLSSMALPSSRTSTPMTQTTSPLPFRARSPPPPRRRVS
jgi:hypothetical protein